MIRAVPVLIPSNISRIISFSDELLSFVKENKNRFTYPDPTTEDIGGKFVRTIIYEVIGQDRVMELMKYENLTEEALYEMIKPAIDYLVELDKYILKI